MELEHRVIKLEMLVDNHAAELEKLLDITKHLRGSLANIEKTLAQLKWLATGAVLALVANSIGLAEVIKMVL